MYKKNIHIRKERFTKFFTSFNYYAICRPLRPIVHLSTSNQPPIIADNLACRDTLYSFAFLFFWPTINCGGKLCYHQTNRGKWHVQWRHECEQRLDNWCQHLHNYSKPLAVCFATSKWSHIFEATPTSVTQTNLLSQKYRLDNI